MASVFNHLTKKWKPVVDNAHELSLISSNSRGNSLYQHTCGDMTIEDFCGIMDEITVVFYRWEMYSVNTEPLGNDGVSQLFKDSVMEKTSQEEDQSTVLTQSQMDDVVHDANSDSFLGSSTLSLDSHNSDMEWNDFIKDTIIQDIPQPSLDICLPSFFAV